MADRRIRRRVEALKRQKMVTKKIVDLQDYRRLRYGRDHRNILVVDDDRMILSALKRVLENREYRVILAQDGIELSHLLESTRFHLFLLDVHLPWVDGYELCQLIKSYPKYQDLPLILMSALSRDEDIEKGYKSGCDGYIVKPFEIDSVLQVVTSAIG